MPLLIKLPIERTKGVGFLDCRSLMVREALFVFNPVINLTMIILHMVGEPLMYLCTLHTRIRTMSTVNELSQTKKKKKSPNSVCWTFYDIVWSCSNDRHSRKELGFVDFCCTKTRLRAIQFDHLARYALHLWKDIRINLFKLYIALIYWLVCAWEYITWIMTYRNSG